MDPRITKETLAHLAKLARLKLTAKEEERLAHDLRNIVAYVAQLQEADTTPAAEVNEKTDSTESPKINAVDNFRDDEERENTNRGKGVDQFPDREEGYLKVPPVF